MENELLTSLKTLTQELAQLADSHGFIVEQRELKPKEVKRLLFQMSSLANELFTEIDRIEQELAEQAYYDGE